MASEPLLSRFATPLPAQQRPALRQNSDTQTVEVEHQGVWIPASQNIELFGYGQTKTAVQQESTDYA